MLTTESVTPTPAPTLRQVPLQLQFIGDVLQISAADPALNVEPDYITYKLKRTEEHLLVEFVFPATVDGYTLTVAPVDGGALLPLALHEDCQVQLSFAAASPEAAAKPKLPSKPMIRVRPAGGG